MSISAFGTIAATVRGRPVALGPLKQRMLLAILLCRPGTEVPSDELIDALWTGQPPPSAANNLRSYVFGLRRVLGKELIAGNGRPGYQLHIDRLATDIAEFDALCADAVEALDRDDVVGARDTLLAAVALRRDRPFADVAHLPVIADEVAGLEERWLLAVEQRFDVDLRLDRAGELVAELTKLTVQFPYRERFWEQLMLALYRSGRQSDALSAYQNARRTLLDELGIEPGPALRAMQRRMLDADAGLMGRVPRAEVPAAAPAQLPLDVRGFAGRDSELDQLDALAAATDGRPTAIAISAVSGTAGVGKTALAVHWAHRVVHRYPDGQLYLNLRGFDSGGAWLKAEEAIRALLDALDVAPNRVPAGLAAQAALYRSLLAGRRMLVVLDNARDDDQVRPLLPGSPGCLVIVTSRNQLSGLTATEGAHPLILELLDVPQARQLFAQRIGSDRMLAESEAVDDIIDRCARLPLALAVVAARAVTHPSFPLRALADELTQVQAPLDAFDSPDPASDVRSVFSWSYETLSGGAARLFRLLGVHPGPHISAAAAASLAGTTSGLIRPLLAELTRAHLLTEYRPGRYTFHDLLRAYAVELANDDARTAAIRRTLDHYIHTAHRAALLLRPHRDPLDLAAPAPGVTPEDPADRDGAMAWFTTEKAVLFGVIAQAEREGFDSEVWKIAWTCSEFLERQGMWQENVVAQHRAQAAANRIGDRAGEAHAHRALGMCYARLTHYDEANHHLERALALSRELGDHQGQARTHNNTSGILELQGRYLEAIDHSVQALELHRASGHQAGQANALNNIGWYYALVGDYAAALRHCQQALAIHSAIGEKAGWAATCDSIGYVHHQLGDQDQAIASYLRAHALFQELGNRYYEAHTLVNLGDAHLANKDDESADRVWREALATLEELGHPEAETVRAKLAGS